MMLLTNLYYQELRQLSWFTKLKALVLVFIFLVVFSRPVGAVEPSLLFSPGSKTVKVNDEFEVNIQLETAGYDVGGAGAEINFEPAKLEALAVSLGTIFADYPVAIKDNAKGKIIISGIVASPSQLYNGFGTFARVSFKAKALGKTSLTFSHELGNTKDSNIAVMTGEGDILATVNQFSLTIESAGGGDQGGGGTVPSPSPSPPPDEDEEQQQDQSTAPPWDFLAKLVDLLALKSNLNLDTGVSRTGREESQALAAYEPLPRQSPISDLDQSQPTTIEPVFVSKEKKPGLGAFSTTDWLLAGLTLVTTVFLVIWLKQQRRQKQQKPLS